MCTFERSLRVIILTAMCMSIKQLAVRGVCVRLNSKRRFIKLKFN